MQSYDAAQHAWHFIEKSKAMVLLNTLKDADAKTNSQIPDELLKEEYDLRVELLYLQRSIAEQEMKKEEARDKGFIDECQSKLFEYNEKWQGLINRFEREYPDYFNLKHQTRLPELAQYKPFLTPQSLLINYLVGTQYIYVCTLSATALQFYRLDKPADFDQCCTDALGYVKRNRNKYFAVANRLYQLLIQAVLPANAGTDLKHLIIIPDGKLRDLPFESLLSAEPSDKMSFANQPYLINQYAVSYHYSAALWLYGEQRAAQKPQIPNSFIGFAPVYPDKAPVYVPMPDEFPGLDIDINPTDMPPELMQPQASGKFSVEIKTYRSRKNKGVFRSVLLNGEPFCELLKSEEEVNTIANLFKQHRLNGNTYLHHHATKQNVLQQSTFYKYVLIAAHNDFNPQNPDFSGILLAPEPGNSEATVFTVTETYHLNLKLAALVVLSCCDSGRGADIRGEGTMAMNRGLLFSGADRVMYTLFKIPDAESATLMLYMFEELLKQKKPNHVQCLALAKRRFLAQYPQLSPQHWAGFVLLG